MISSRKGITAEFLVPAILILVVILLVLIAFTNTRIPRTFEEFSNLTQGTIRLWEKMTGADEEKLLEEKQAQFSQSYLGLVESYRACSSKKQENCFCKIPDVEQLGFEDYLVTVEQYDDKKILFQPLTHFEGNPIVLPPGPQLVPGRLCVLRDGWGHPTPYNNPYIIDYPSSLQLQLNSEHPLDYVEMVYSTKKTNKVFENLLIFGSSFYKFHSLEYNASIVCFANAVYSNSQKNLCS
jgi:hypothetical protein